MRGETGLGMTGSLWSEGLALRGSGSGFTSNNQGQEGEIWFISQLGIRFTCMFPWEKTENGVNTSGADGATA